LKRIFHDAFLQFEGAYLVSYFKTKGCISEYIVFKVLKNFQVYMGEAAAISMGLLMAGTPSDKATEMFVYAHETQHEKMI
nr:26S proteasome non-ATPase regulatory subunit 1 homolog A-like [Tanacetum cinerariifolium]